MLRDVSLALGQLTDARFTGILLRAVGLTLLLLAGVYGLWVFGMSFLPDLGFSVFGYEVTFLNAVVDTAAYGAGLFLASLLMFPVAALFIGFYLEDIADAVEDKHYPHLPPAGRTGWVDILVDGLIFTAILIGVNAVGLIFYLISGPLAPFFFLAVNGYLLGRQYFELVAARRIGFAAARKLRRRRRLSAWVAGVAMAAPLSVPVLNLIVPLVGVASFTHMVQRVGRNEIGRPPSETARETG